jgi:nucleotide-binding universal stress UspA family protein
VTNQPPKQVIQRILVALDASTHSLAGLQAAAELAARLNAELIGLFVEDINLLRLVGTPFAQEVGDYSAMKRKLVPGELERRMRAQANSARQALTRVATETNLAWSFRTVRGSIPAELISATDDTDLIILGKTGWSGRSRVGSTAQAILTQASKLTLILREGVKLGRTLMLIYDGSDSADEALAIAGQLVQEGEGKLIVILIAKNKGEAQRLQESALQWGRGHRLDLQFRWLTEADAFIVCSIARTEESGVLVVPQDSPFLTNETLMTILNDINCPVMFVRQPRPSP